jgi:hypothetical protein
MPIKMCAKIDADQRVRPYHYGRLKSSLDLRDLSNSQHKQSELKGNFQLGRDCGGHSPTMAPSGVSLTQSADSSEPEFKSAALNQVPTESKGPSHLLRLSHLGAEQCAKYARKQRLTQRPTSPSMKPKVIITVPVIYANKASERTK